MRDLRQAACRAQAFESVDQFVAFLAPAHHHGRQLPIALQRPRHGAFRFRHVQAIASVVFADLLAFQIEQIVVGPAQHSRPFLAGQVECKPVAGADQYVTA